MQLQAEMAIIGATLEHPELVGELNLPAKAFVDERHFWIWWAVVQLHRSNKPITALTVNDLLEKSGQEHRCAPEYVIQMRAMALTPKEARASVGVLIDAYRRRRRIEQARELVDMATNPDISLEELDRQFDAAAAETVTTGADDMASISRIYDWLATEYENRDKPQEGTVTWFAQHLDERMPLYPEEVTVVAARTSHGKTLVVMQEAAHAAKHHGPVAFFQLEMGESQLFQRFLGTGAMVPVKDLRRRKLLPAEWNRVFEAAGKLANTPLYYRTMAAQRSDDMRARCLALRAKHGRLALVAIDYLQLVADEQKRTDRRDQVIGRVMRAAKAIAKDCHCPVLVASQLNRESEKRNNKRPTLADLRESGDIEQDADQVALLMIPEKYPEVYTGDKYCNRMAVYIAKNRMEGTSTMWLAWQGATGLLYHLPASEWPKED